MKSLHILAAIVWIGGMSFLVLVVVPWLRKKGGGTDAGRFLRETGERFRNVFELRDVAFRRHVLSAWPLADHGCARSLHAACAIRAAA